MPIQHFVQGCPTCGRKLQVLIEYDGQEMVCQHCGGDFFAKATAVQSETNDDILDRVEALLDSPPPRRPR